MNNDRAFRTAQAAYDRAEPPNDARLDAQYEIKETTMPDFEIKHRYTGEMLYAGGGEALRDVVESAVRSRADLSGANLSRADLSVANLSGADLINANLSGADLINADLSGADLINANLSGADLINADLSGADLINANLSGADLINADLSGANLINANLSGADLSVANLSGANLSGAEGVIALGTPDGWHAHAWLRDGVLSISVGCQEKRLAEARAYWTGKDDRREVMAALDYAESVARIRGWKMEVES